MADEAVKFVFQLEDTTAATGGTGGDAPPKRNPRTNMAEQAEAARPRQQEAAAAQSVKSASGAQRVQAAAGIAQTAFSGNITGAAGGALAMGGPAGTAVAAALAAGGALATAPFAAAGAIQRQAAPLAPYSPELARAKAQNEAADTMRKLHDAQKFGGDLALVERAAGTAYRELGSAAGGAAALAAPAVTLALQAISSELKRYATTFERFNDPDFREMIRAFPVLGSSFAALVDSNDELRKIAEKNQAALDRNALAANPFEFWQTYGFKDSDLPVADEPFVFDFELRNPPKIFGEENVFVPPK